MALVGEKEEKKYKQTGESSKRLRHICIKTCEKNKIISKYTINTTNKNNTRHEQRKMSRREKVDSNSLKNHKK